MKRAWLAWLVDARVARGVLLLTLTFRGDGAGARNAIRRFTDLMRKRYGVDKYFWWAELQKRGTVHYHMVIADIRFIPKQQVAKMWGHGFVDLRWIGNLQGIHRYVSKYVQKLRKGYQQDYRRFHKLYRGFRIFGSNRLRDLDARILKLPSWLAGLADRLKEVPRRAAGGWEFGALRVRSPWVLGEVVRRLGGGWLVRLVWVGIRFEARPLVEC